MTCPFCGESQVSARSRSMSFRCGTWATQGHVGVSYDRGKDCLAREVSSLRRRVANLDDEARDWREYAEALERIGEGMKHTASACDAVKWNNRLARRPEPSVHATVKEVQP